MDAGADVRGREVRARLLTDLVIEPEPVDPALDAAISHAVMLRVAGGELPDTLRFSRPSASVAFGKRDVVADGYAGAVAAARAAGFEPIERLAGGRASAFHEQTVHLSHSVRDAEPRQAVTERFEATAELVAGALRGLGADARVGEVEGEYCPGEHSVNARGAVKLMGVGQRVVRQCAHVGGVLVVDGADRIRSVLGPVYDALGLSWRPDTTGGLADEIGPLAWDDAVVALASAYGERHRLRPASLDDDTLALADRLAAEHRSPSA